LAPRPRMIKTPLSGALESPEDLERFLIQYGVPAPTLAAGVAFEEAARLWKLGVYDEVLPFVRKAADGGDERAACLLALALAGIDENFADAWNLAEDSAEAWRRARDAARSGNPAAIWTRNIMAVSILNNGPDELTEEALHSLGYEPLQALVAREVKSEEFRRAMEELSGEQRAALELAYFGGKTSTEVAELEGIPVGTAKTRIRTALLRLRESMAEGAP